jgi:hypothetical protein
MREWVLQQQVADEFVSVPTHFASANESEIRAFSASPPVQEKRVCNAPQAGARSIARSHTLCRPRGLPGSCAVYQSPARSTSHLRGVFFPPPLTVVILSRYYF